MKTFMCVTLLAFWSTQASEAPKNWSDWASEGKALTSAGKYSDAAQTFRRALVLAKGSDAGNRALLGIYTDLASVYAEVGQHAESEREYRHALDIAERTQGRQSLDYALLVVGLAVLPTQIGNRDSFIAPLREAIAVNGRTGSAGDLAIIRRCLIQILMYERRYAEAESVLLDVQPDFASLKEANPKLLAGLLNDFGMLRFNQGCYSESKELFQESLRLFKNLVGEEHWALLVPSSNLALSYLKLGQLNDADLTLQRAIPCCRKTLGEDHPTCGALLENYAAVLRKLGRKQESKELARRSQEIVRAFRRHNGIGSTVSVAALRPDLN